MASTSLQFKVMENYQVSRDWSFMAFSSSFLLSWEIKACTESLLTLICIVKVTCPVLP